METTDIILKTDAGTDELKSRARKLPQRLRTMLILVDGTLTAGQLTQLALKAEVPEDFLLQLQQHGMVVRVPAGVAGVVPGAAAVAPVAPTTEPEKFLAAQRFMNDSVVDALGLRAFFFTLKLERAFNRADLQALLPAYLAAITKGNGGTASRAMEARVRQLLVG